MDNISWYGGASVQALRWPINDVDISMQPFSVSDLRDNPSGFGSVLERYFLGSSGEKRYKGSSTSASVLSCVCNVTLYYIHISHSILPYSLSLSCNK